MLYGNIIFIKKTGGDGSKYPVTEKNIKIGRSENCLIRIYNPQVAPEHCQLIIDCNGQAKLRNLFTPTILNGKPLGQGDVTLCHGDVFKLGERLARWEYLPTSKYFRQLLSPTGRLVAVVNPQRRSVDTLGVSSTQATASKNTPLGKRKLSDKYATETPTMAKERKELHLDPTYKAKMDLGKLLIGRHSFKSGRCLLKTPLAKQRKSVSGAIGSKTSKAKHELTRKSTLPSWKVSTESKKSPPKGRVKTPTKKNEVRTPSKSTPIKLKTPKRLKLESGKKTPLKTIVESPPKPEPYRKSPVKKTTPKQKSPTRLVQSERKPRTPKSKKERKMSLVLNKVDRDRRISKSDRKSFLGKKTPKGRGARVDGSPAKGNSKSDRKSSVKTAPVKTPRNFSKKETGSSGTPLLIDFSDDTVNAQRTSRTSVRCPEKSSVDIFQTPRVSVKPRQSVSGSRKSGKVASPQKTPGDSKGKDFAPKSVRRKLSPSISSAERAAKKLKTSSPKKPDKNKRAALLILGKASRKQLLSQNMKVLLKQKILKKAIKQSVGLPKRKEEKKKKAGVKKTKKVTQKVEKKSPVKTPQTVKESPGSINEVESAPNVKTPDSSINKSKISSLAPLSPVPAISSPKSAKNISIVSPKSTKETVSPYVKFSKDFFFDSNRRCSKRLTSKIDTECSDFVELSPTALGLIPKNMAIFKTPKERKRQSSSLVTPRNVRTMGIIKSASTSKIGNRKSVSFLSKELSVSTTSFTPGVSEKTDFDFDSFHTSNITMEVFVSPLNKSSESAVGGFVTNENKKLAGKSKGTPRKVARKLLESSTTEINLWDVIKDANKNQKSPKNELTDLKGVRQLLTTPKQVKSPKNDLSDVGGVKKLFATPKVQKSPKNDLSDVKGVKKLMRTPKVQKSPKNDLSNVKGVKKLMSTPKVQKSPKNDLSDVRGVKKLMKTPRLQKSPKNDLSDVRGVKKLMRSPRVQKSPKNDLTDVRGVKKLMGTPKQPKSPKNDLSDVKGVKKLMRTPKQQKSPNNALTDLRGVKRLLQSPKAHRSPKNDLTDVTGVKNLLKTPKPQKSPRNNLSDVGGLEELFASPKQPKTSKAKKASEDPKNNLSDVTGVRELFTRHKPISDYNVDLTGVAELFEENEDKTVATKRRRPQKKEVAAEKGKTRGTRSMKSETVPDVEEKESRGSKRMKIENPKTVKKVTKKEVETSKKEAPKSAKKRKAAEAIETSPPKLRKKTAAAAATPKKTAATTPKKTVSKAKSQEPKAAAAKTKTRKAERKDEAKGLKKSPGKAKTPAKKASKVQSKTTKSGAKTQKVQKGRSQPGSKKDSPKSGSKLSPRKTRSVSAKTQASKR